MPDRYAKKLPAYGWLHAPLAMGPVGGGMVQLCGGNTWTVLTIALAPHALRLLIYTPYLLAHVAAVACYVLSGADEPRAAARRNTAERLIFASCNASIAALTLKRLPLDGQARADEAPATTRSAQGGR